MVCAGPPSINKILTCAGLCDPMKTMQFGMKLGAMRQARASLKKMVFIARMVCTGCCAAMKTMILILMPWRIHVQFQTLLFATLTEVCLSDIPGQQQTLHAEHICIHCSPRVYVISNNSEGKT